jgi:hypothetical protein
MCKESRGSKCEESLFVYPRFSARRHGPARR